MSILKVDSLSVQRGGHVLVDALDFTLQAGRICAVLGPNGAGKSSLLLAIAGLIPFQGRVELAGRSLSALGRAGLADRVAWQGDLPSVEFGLTVHQRLELAASGDTGGIASIAGEMEIGALLGRPLGELSAGERQRTELAALMLRDVPLWLMDEPTAHLDLRHQVQCIGMLRRRRQQGRSILVVLHDLAQAMAVADHVILVDGQGHAAYGDADMLDAGRLSQLYATPLCRQGSGFGPDYGEKR
ncbi:MAG: iron dicitrate ABC transporter ATP-binding protein [Zetaproteobacteria bacterium CG06_land_8_20_14_3_00_59_53]|nr:MAG: iron dicitrate ABC transporter ATP-binding protein [Zetaproteobacteria bacterium CG2_30_59_37]PIO90013.1 MAG: iron dicitrate ABC transporter ATP-binding protein [Zetaproteobacteria bacterium CG23_combo_of_CG06-09_8_20_14_all_59_86]PIQ65016.1 MAG: iron dicitrate ABC transporter ATP-binding protein [Zetaproteobacteria bacterium CG11_big_fil_rev_8_21_14_0_20_59_439]PIU69414.1 MAG: iron dicitrate ABC transporter ATP-binding protein [Zetaproteobacteria bacterium CG06_land_8_20_14_3_00_59_53]